MDERAIPRQTRQDNRKARSAPFSGTADPAQPAPAHGVDVREHLSLALGCDPAHSRQNLNSPVLGCHTAAYARRGAHDGFAVVAPGQ